jgi:hypothetical protein
VLISVVAAVVLVGVLAVLVSNRSEPDSSSAPATVDTAIRQWWSAAHQHFDGLQGALDDVEQALRHVDGPAAEMACQQMHDLAAVGLQAHLPAPDPDLTAELSAAIEDAHTAAHMCLAVVAGTPNSYDGEFMTNVDQAEKHLDAALAKINESLTAA